MHTVFTVIIKGKFVRYKDCIDTKWLQMEVEIVFVN